MSVKFNESKAYHYLVGLTLLTLTAGTVFYHFIEHFSWLNAYYFSVVTLTTIGYGDFAPHTNLGKLFTTLYVFLGVGIITAFISFTMRRRASKITKKHKSSKN